MTEAPLREVPADAGPPRLEVPGWRATLGVVAGITTRGSAEAPFDLGLAGQAPVGEVLPRWHALLSAAAPCRAVAVSRQVHGTTVLTHRRPTDDGLCLTEGADGHVTGQPGLLLAVTLADCLPVYLVEPEARVIGLLHAGWRGVAGGILAEGLRAMVALGARAERTHVHLGVGICGDCYEVGPEVLAACGVPAPTTGRSYLDLRSVLETQTRRAGVGTVTRSVWCASHDHDRFFSHRASGGAGGRMVAYLGLLS